jgi:hypothetical protein
MGQFSNSMRLRVWAEGELTLFLEPLLPPPKLIHEIIDLYRLSVVIFHVFWRDRGSSCSRRIQAMFESSSTELLSISCLVRRFLLLYSQYPVVH